MNTLEDVEISMATKYDKTLPLANSLFLMMLECGLVFRALSIYMYKFRITSQCKAALIRK